MDAATLHAHREAALIAQNRNTQRDLCIMQDTVTQLTNELHRLRLAHSRVSARLAGRDAVLVVIRDRAALAASRLCDPFARLVLTDLARRAAADLDAAA